MKVVVVGIFEDYRDLAVALHVLANSLVGKRKDAPILEFTQTGGPANLRMRIDQDSERCGESMLAEMERARLLLEHVGPPPKS